MTAANGSAPNEFTIPSTVITEPEWLSEAICPEGVQPAPANAPQNRRIIKNGTVFKRDVGRFMGLQVMT